MNKQALIIDFLEWMNEVTQDSPMILETDNDDIAIMYLSSDRPLFNLSPVSTRAFDERIDEEFDIIKCPKCGGTDIIMLRVNKCTECGHQWAG